MLGATVVQDTVDAHVDQLVKNFFRGGGGGSDLGKLAKPSYQMVLERALGIKNQSSPVLRLSHSSV